MTQRALLILTVLFSTGALCTEITPSKIPDIAVMQQNQDGTYSVVCTNGNREQVSDLDIKLGNVCPNESTTTPTEILSLQQREDGDFDVVCKDFRKIVATSQEIMDGNVCTTQQPTIVLENGYYRVSSGYGFCDQKIQARHEQNQLVSLTVSFVNGCSAYRDMTCSQGLCKSTDGYSIEVIQPTRYKFTGSSGNTAIFDQN